MPHRHLLTAATALTIALGAAPASASNDKTSPGNPCAKGNGNPCNGNNGNAGQQGIANKERVKIDNKPSPIPLPMSAVVGRGAFVTQIGEANRAGIVQTAPRAYAEIEQDGERNEADVTQKGSGTAYLETKQTGTSNFARVAQDGSGQNVVYVTQNGNGNWAWANQHANGALHNGAVLTQTGNNNDMILAQNGADNRAVLTQQGDGNGITAVQNGEGNRLAWIQQGNNLSDLQIVQNGGALPGGQLLITQTNQGNGK